MDESIYETETWQADTEEGYEGHQVSNVEASPADNDESTVGPQFKVKDVVEVMPRLWAGINKPGGRARITLVNFDVEEDEYTYNVSYVIHGGSESKVEGIYISLADQEIGSQKKARSTRGRCRWCPSFIKDCGHNQLVDPYYVEPVHDPAADQIQSADQDRVSAKRKLIAAETSAQDSEDLYFNDIDTITEGGAKVEERQHRKRHGGHRSQGSAKKRHRRTSHKSSAVTGDPHEGDGVLVKSKSVRKKYVPPVSMVDYQLLLSSTVEADSEAGVPVVTTQLSGSAGLPETSAAEQAAAATEEARLKSIARANRVGIVIVDSDSDNAGDHDPALDHSDDLVTIEMGTTEVRDDPATSIIPEPPANKIACAASMISPVLPPAPALVAELTPATEPTPAHAHSSDVSVVLNVGRPAAPPVHNAAGSAVPKSIERLSVPSVPVRSGSGSAQATSDLQRAASTASTASAASRTSTLPATTPRSQPVTAPPVVPSSAPAVLTPMKDLHAQILRCCCDERHSAAGADDDDFINNAANSHKDSAAAQVNAQYVRLIESLKHLSRDQRVELFLYTFDWVVENLPLKDAYLSQVTHLEQRLQKLVDNSFSLEALSEREQRIADAIWDDHSTLIDDKDTYFKQIERAGFEVLTKLRHTDSSRVKKKMIAVSSWPLSVNNALLEFNKRIREFEKSYEEAETVWENRDIDSWDGSGSDGSYSSDGGSDSDHIGLLASARGVGTVSATGRVRDAAKEAGTIVRKPSVQRDDTDRGHALSRSHSAHSHGSTAQGRTNKPHSAAGAGSGAPLARAGSTSSRSVEPVAAGHRNASASSAAVHHSAGVDGQASKRARSDGTCPLPRSSSAVSRRDDHGAVHYTFGDDGPDDAGDYYDNEYFGPEGGLIPEPADDIDAFESDGSSDGGDRAGAESAWKVRGAHRYRHFVPSAGHRPSAPIAATGTGTGARSSAGRSTVNTTYPQSKIERDLEQVFGQRGSGDKKSTGDTGKSKTSSSRTAQGGEASARGVAKQGTDGAGHHYSRKVPTVADLPAQVRYHGRVVVLEGLLSHPAGSTGPASNAHGGASLSVPVSSSFSHAATARSPMLPVGANLSIPERTARVSTAAHAANPSTEGRGGPAVQKSSATGSSVGHPLNATAAEDDFTAENEDLVDVVLSGLANPFVTEPPLHLRQPFYQVSGQPAVGESPPLKNREVKVQMWAKEFIARVAASSTLQTAASTGTRASVVGQVSAAALASVSEILHKLTTFRDLESRCSALQNSPRSDSASAEAEQRKRTALINAQFQGKETWAALVTFSTEKLSKIGHLFHEVLLVHRSDSGGEGLAELLQQGYGALERRLYAHMSALREPEAALPSASRNCASIAPATKPSETLVPSCLAGCLLNALSDLHTHKCDELAVYLLLNLVRHEVSVLVDCALRTVNAAKLRPVVCATDKDATALRAAEEKGDWEVMNQCFAELLAIQDSMVAALLWNKRLLLGILYHLSVTSTRCTASSTESNPAGIEFKRGFSCTVKVFSTLLYEILHSLRTLYATVNAARISTNGSAAGARIWACYDASREQVNGPIASYHKNVWTGIVAAVYAQLSRGRASLFSPCARFDAPPDVSKLTIGSVNQSTWSAQNPSAAVGGPGDDSVWGVLTVISHCLRTVANAVVAAASSTPDATTAAVRVDGCWGMLKGLTEVAVTNLCKQCTDLSAVSGVSTDADKIELRNTLTTQLSGVLRRVSLFAAVWTDAAAEAPALYLSVLSQSAAVFNTLLPLSILKTLGTKSGTEPAPHTRIGTTDAVGAVDSKSVLLLCFHAYFSCKTNDSSGSRSAESRFDLHRQLLFVVSMLFKACGVPNPYSAGGDGGAQSIGAVLTSDAAAESLAALSAESMRVINEIRRTFKDLLYNASTEASAAGDATGFNANIAAAKSAALKVPKVYAKTQLLAVLSRNPDSALQCGIIASLLVKELSSIYGQDAVRNKLKIAASTSAQPSVGPSKETPLPLQEQLMKFFAGKVAEAVTGDASCGGLSTTAISAPAITPSSLSAQVEQLLQQVPLNQQRDTKTGDAIDVMTSEAARRSTSLCLLAFVGLLTVLPFPVESGTDVSVIPHDVAVIKQTDIKRVFDAHRAHALYLEPALHVIRVITKLHAERTLAHEPELMAALLGTSLNTCATLLRYLGAVTAAEYSIPLRCGLTELFQPLACLHAPLVKEVIAVVQVCLYQSSGAKSRDGLHVSAMFGTGLLVQFLTTWHRQRAELATTAARASNVDPAALTLLQHTISEDLVLFHELVSDLLHIAPVPVVHSRIVAAPAATSKSIGSELVNNLKAHLVQLTLSLKSQDVSAMDFASTLVSSAGAFDSTQMRLLKAKKLNATAGACFAVCKSLGSLTAMLLTIATETVSGMDQRTSLVAAGSATSTIATTTALVAEVLECLEKISAAAAGGANTMLGIWLRVVFWVPVLQCISDLCARPNSGELPGLLQPHIPSLLSDWSACALLRDSTAAMRNLSEHIQLSEFCNQLTTLSVSMVLSVNFKYAAVGAAKLTGIELQSWRLCELFLQVCEANPADSSMDKRVKAVQYLRLLASGGTSAVLGELIVVNVAGGSASAGAVRSARALTYAFPAAHRVTFESVNSALIKELCRCLKCLTMAVFHSPDAKDKARLKDLTAELKGLVADSSYLTRSLLHNPLLLARVKVPRANSNNSYGAGGVTWELDSMPLTAQLLRGINQLPSMVPLDLVVTFILDYIEPDVINLISSMFQYVLSEHTKSNAPITANSSAVAKTVSAGAPEMSLQSLQEEAERSILCNLPRFILMTSGTPYSTRQIAWRRMLVPVFISSTYCAAGAAANENAESVLLCERTMDEIPYFMLLVWALTLALPVPERLTLLMPALQADSENSLRSAFVELVTSHLKMPVKASTLWRLYKIFISMIRSFSAEPKVIAVSANPAESGGLGAAKQDPQLLRFRQYLLLSAGALTTDSTAATAFSSTTTANTSNSAFVSICSQRNGLWEALHQNALKSLSERVAEEQGKLAVQANTFAHTSAATVMTVLPWTAVKTALHLHVTALEVAIDAVIDRHSIANVPPAPATAVTAFVSTQASLPSAPVSIPTPFLQINAEKEELLCLVVTSAVHMVRVVLTSATVHRAHTQHRLVTDSTKQRLLLQLQQCRLSAAAVAAMYQHILNICCAGAGNMGITDECNVVRLWVALVRTLSTLLQVPTHLDTSAGEDTNSLEAFEDAVACMRGGLYGYVNCTNARTQPHLLEAPAAVSQSYKSCRCMLCIAAIGDPAAANRPRSDTCINTLIHYVALLDTCGRAENATFAESLLAAGISTTEICIELGTVVSSAQIV